MTACDLQGLVVNTRITGESSVSPVGPSTGAVGLQLVGRRACADQGHWEAELESPLGGMLLLLGV